ncbi:MAG TPA: isocitrate/isopropylmalate family dehydrogenase, partial [Thermoplasmata archaeon]
QYYLAHQREWEPEAEAASRRAEAILLGAIGWPGATLPNGDNAGVSLVLGLRQALDLYANVRPCRLYPGVQHRISAGYQSVWEPKNVDMVIVRENTEGLYTPARGRLKRAGETEVVIDTRVLTKKGSERVIRYAFELTKARARGAPEDGRSRVTCVDKSNVLEGCRFFRETYDRIAATYPGVERDYAYVDAFTQWLVRNPEHFDVVVSTNMMGDIITDLASVLQGGMGFAAGGNIGDHHAMFEPVHGSAPKYAGKNQVNPFATFFAVEMMLRWLSDRHHDLRLARQADRLERAVGKVLTSGTARTYDQGGTVTTSGAGDRVAAAIRQEPK